MKLKTYFLLASILLSGVPAFAQNTDETRAFADSLFTAGRLDQALSVYQRTAFFMRPVVDAEILCRIADCFFNAGDMEKALEYYDHSYFAQANDSIKKEVLFRKTACYLRSHNYNFALMELLSLEDNLSAGFEKKRNFFMAMTWYGLEDFTKAGSFFEKSLVNSENKEKINKIFADKKQFYRPNPKVASWFSTFLPGSGQIYSGETFSGINSLLLTGFFVGFGFYIVTVSTPLDAIFTALPWFQRYYQGGFQRAADLAKNKRAEHRNEIFNEILSVIESEK
jgi:tetratricopeptide (TPR) repeat protein